MVNSITKMLRPGGHCQQQLTGLCFLVISCTWSKMLCTVVVGTLAVDAQWLQYFAVEHKVTQQQSVSPRISKISFVSTLVDKAKCHGSHDSRCGLLIFVVTDVFLPQMLPASPAKYIYIRVLVLHHGCSGIKPGCWFDLWPWQQHFDRAKCKNTGI